MSDGLLHIGAFSRASLLSVKALRAYHESGILVPARVDPHTGYRAYHASQLLDAAVVQRLRALDLPLAAVREVLRARDPEITGKILASHETAMRQRLAEVERIVAELHHGVALPETHTPVHVRTEPHRHSLAVRGVVDMDNFSAFLSEAYDTLVRVANGAAAVTSGPEGALYPPEVASDGPEPVEAFLPIASPVALEGAGRVVVSEVPAARVAVLLHSGPYDTIDDSYRALGAWVAHHAESADLPVRELYLVSSTDTDDSERFRTEICWPISL